MALRGIDQFGQTLGMHGMDIETSELARARDMYGRGLLDESEAIYRCLVDNVSIRSQVLAALGLIAFQRRDIDNAKRQLRASLDSGNNADAHYGLGVIAESEGRTGDALLHYNSAIEPGSHHVDASRRLDRLKARRTDAVDTVPNARPGNFNSEKEVPVQVTPTQPTPQLRVNDGDSIEGFTYDAGFYAILTGDARSKASASASLSRECLRIIDRISASYRPRRSAYPFATFLFWLMSVFLVLGLLWSGAFMIFGRA
jgi:tetratricopeptide (TPR) repeat protein